MKVRNGFVSNSSSSSFCIFGSEVAKSYLNEDFFEKNFKELCKDMRVAPETPEELEEGMDFCEIIEFLGLEHYYDGWAHYAGLSWSCIDDDQTGKEFKEGVKAILSEHFQVSKLSFDTIEGEYPC